MYIMVQHFLTLKNNKNKYDISIGSGSFRLIYGAKQCECGPTSNKIKILGCVAPDRRTDRGTRSEQAACEIST